MAQGAVEGLVLFGLGNGRRGYHALTDKLAPMKGGKMIRNRELDGRLGAIRLGQHVLHDSSEPTRWFAFPTILLIGDVRHFVALSGE